MTQWWQQQCNGCDSTVVSSGVETGIMKCIGCFIDYTSQTDRGMASTSANDIHGSCPARETMH